MRDPLWELSKVFRLRFFYVATRGNIKRLIAVYVFVTSFLGLSVLGGITLLFYWPLLFPSLGPTTFLIFYAPARAMSWPRNCIMGHLSGMVCGFLAFLVLYCFFPEKAMKTEFDLIKILFISGAVGLTALIMVLADILHPPAASTAMIAAAGYFKHPTEVLGFIMALLLLVFEGIIFHRLSGIVYPWWSGDKKEQPPPIRTKIGEVGEISVPKDPYAELAHRLTTRRE